MNKIKKNDIVAVRTGKDKGKIGKVLKVIFDKNKVISRVIVQGINIQTHYNKPKGMQSGSIEKKEGSIHVSNVSIVNPSIYNDQMDSIKSLKDCVKIGFKLEGNKKIRFVKKTGVAI
ncbi:MAG: 50S ribosomal protein L24 [Rickettsiales bacterium]